MKILVITQAQNQQLKANLANLLGAATILHPHCDLAIIGELATNDLAQFACIDKIIQFSVDAAHNLSSLMAKELAKLVKDYTHVLIAADSYGKDLLPRIAGVLDLAQISEISKICSPNIFQRLIYAGNIQAEVESFEDIKLLSVRCTNFAPYTNKAASVPKHELGELVLEDNLGLRLLDTQMNAINGVDLAQAKVVVSGGRALVSKENFVNLIEGLANCLGAGVGASRAAVEAGYANNDSQIGQTGKIIAPELYLAVGISGAVQHLAGIKNAKTVIAINLDQNAQFFEYADYGLVGDLFEIIPQLMHELAN